MCGPEDPLFTAFHASPAARKGPISSKRRSVHKTSFWENFEILALTASIFTQIWAHKPPNVEIFSSQACKFGNFPLTSPPFSEANVSSQAHTLEIRAAHPYLEKKLSAPPGARLEHFLNLSLFSCMFSYFSSNFLHFLPHLVFRVGGLEHRLGNHKEKKYRFSVWNLHMTKLKTCDLFTVSPL